LLLRTASVGTIGVRKFVAMDRFDRDGRRPAYFSTPNAPLEAKTHLPSCRPEFFQKEAVVQIPSQVRGGESLSAQKLQGNLRDRIRRPVGGS
jgi:hypothetical protein